MQLSDCLFLQDRDFKIFYRDPNGQHIHYTKNHLAPFLRSFENGPTSAKWAGIKYAYQEIAGYPDISDRDPLQQVIIETVVRIWKKVHPLFQEGKNFSLASEITTFFAQELQTPRAPRISQDVIFATLVQAATLVLKPANQPETSADEEAKNLDESAVAKVRGVMALSVFQRIRSPAFNSVVERCCGRVLKIQSQLREEVEAKLEDRLVSEATYFIDALVSFSPHPDLTKDSCTLLRRTLVKLGEPIQHVPVPTVYALAAHLVSLTFLTQKQVSDRLIPLAQDALSNLKTPAESAPPARSGKDTTHNIHYYFDV